MAEKKTSKTNVSKEEKQDVVEVSEETMSSATEEALPSTEELLKQIVELQKQVAQLSISKEKEEDVEPPKEKMIRFISLARGSVLLKGTANRPYEIEGRFSDRWFSESEARAIVNLMGSYMREGFVYIDDAKFVKAVGLADVYKTMLTPEILQNLFNQSPDTVVNIYENATDGQKKIILDMIYEKKNKGVNIDANILMQIGKLAGMDLISDFDE